MTQRNMVLIVSAVFSLGLLGIAVAGPFEDGQEAYFRNDYATAMRLLLPLAERGDASAQELVGDMNLWSSPA